MLIKYKKVYKVTISGKEVGYVSNKAEFEKIIEKEIIENSQVNIAFVDYDKPEFEAVLANSDTETNETEIISEISQSAVITYKVYQIAVNGEKGTYVNTLEEAEETIEKIKEESEISSDIDISVEEIYTQNIEEAMGTVEVESAVEEVETGIEEIVKEKIKIANSTLDGVYFAVKPVSGIITSRYGQREGSSIVSSNHKGIDIGASYGTTIVAAADGEVTYSGWMGGYGNLIIITHDNGITTYYGHCSKLYANVGDVVKAGDKIAAVGSTGNSTGNHLHFEIRKNGEQINPQKYIYK